jgi:hypothetical protein
MNFHQAFQQCSEYGLKLLSIETNEEFDCILDIEKSLRKNQFKYMPWDHIQIIKQMKCGPMQRTGHRDQMQDMAATLNTHGVVLGHFWTQPLLGLQTKVIWAKDACLLILQDQDWRIDCVWIYYRLFAKYQCRPTFSHKILLAFVYNYYCCDFLPEVIPYLIKMWNFNSRELCQNVRQSVQLSAGKM